LKVLRPQIAAGIPVIVLEPICLAVFRDEMPNLFPDDEDAKRLCAQTYAFSEFLGEKASRMKLPKFSRRALVHGHCHQKALMKMDTEEQTLEKLGLDFEILDSGCCGMAGSFGFEKDHYDISIEIGEQVLLPAVRRAAPDTLIIANGFSCREQIAQTTGRQAMHLVEVMRMAVADGANRTRTRTRA
jgi:Fe-S oxidoreductase